jgi:hypothetical protein
MKAEWVLVVGLASILVGCGKPDPVPPVSTVPQAPAEPPPILQPTVVGAPASTPPPPPTTPAPPAVVPATVVTAAPLATATVAPSVTVPETANPPARAQKALDTLKRVVDAIPQVQPPVSGAAPTTPAAAAMPSTVSDLPVDQVTKGLKEALGKGLEHAVASLGKSGGFLTNMNVKIPIPEKFQTVEKTLRTIGQERLADEFVTTMNQAAEQAVPAAAAVFKESLQKMTVADAKKILTGPNDAATRYFRETTQAELTTRFLPIVQKATAASGATAAYKQVTDKVKVAGPFVRVPELDLDGYVTAKALDGLFVRVAEEERRIRETPAARGTELLQKVFGAMGR